MGFSNKAKKKTSKKKTAGKKPKENLLWKITFQRTVAKGKAIYIPFEQQQLFIITRRITEKELRKHINHWAKDFRIDEETLEIEELGVAHVLT